MADGRIPGTFGDAFSNAPAVNFSEPSAAEQGLSFNGACSGRIPGTYGNGAANADPAPAVSFEGQGFMNEQPINTEFGNGTWLGEWGGKRG